MDITFITGNPRKAAYLAENLGVPIAHHRLDLPEIQSLNLEEIVWHKAQEAYRILGTPVLVEDSALSFAALNGLPGPLIKWFEHGLGYDGLCHLLDGYDDRSATASVTYGLFDGASIRYFSGSASGRIADHPRGESTFGWDPTFIHDGDERTRAELSREEADARSPRHAALKELAAFLAR